MTKDVVLKMNVEDFADLFILIRDQSRKYQSKHLIKREYAASKNHPYNQSPIPVYEKINGNYILVSGLENFREEINVTIGTDYSDELNTNEYESNRNIKLDLENIRFMKKRYVIDHNTGKDFKSFDKSLSQFKNHLKEMYIPPFRRGAGRDSTHQQLIRQVHHTLPIEDNIIPYFIGIKGHNIKKFRPSCHQ